MEKAKSMETGMQTIIGSIRNLADDRKIVLKKSLIQRMKFVFGNMTVEPVMIFYILPSIMTTIAVQNLNLEKACRVNLGISVEHCDALSIRNESAYVDYRKDEENVQKLASYMTIIKSIVQSIIPGIVLLFLGAWSDKFLKRKPCMLIPILGDMFCVLGLMFCTYFYYELPIEVNSFFESVFPAISGTWFAMFTGVYSYVGDISSEEERTIRVGTVNTLANIGMCVGTALSGILFKTVGFYGVYLTAMIMYSFALVYGYFWVTDTCDVPGTRIEHSQGFIKDFFQTSHIKDTFNTVFATDNSSRKQQVICIMILFILIMGPIYGELNVVYFFARFKFGWDALQFSYFSTFQFITSTLGTVFSLSLFSKHLNMHDTILGIISCISKVFASVIYAFAASPIYYFAGAIVEMLNGTSFIALRAMISKVVSSEELGKINSLFGILEAAVPLLYGPIYSRIYAKTIDYFPGCFYLVGGGLVIPGMVIFYWLYCENKKISKQEPKEVEDQLLNIQSDKVLKL